MHALLNTAAGLDKPNAHPEDDKFVCEILVISKVSLNVD
jgi:hypothetical protein